MWNLLALISYTWGQYAFPQVDKLGVFINEPFQELAAHLPGAWAV